MPPQSLLKIQHPLVSCSVALRGLVGEYIDLKNFEIILLSWEICPISQSNQIWLFLSKFLVSCAVTENYFQFSLLLNRRTFQIQQFVKFSFMRIGHCYFQICFKLEEALKLYYVKTKAEHMLSSFCTIFQETQLLGIGT